MKKRILFASLLSALIILSSCFQNTAYDVEKQPEDSEQISEVVEENVPDALPEIETETETAVEITENNGVSPLAEEYFLEPFDKYSWDREYPAEKVVIHFTSAVVLSRDDPYNMGTIRKIFEDNELSIHYILDRNGKVYCYMPETRCAWHAGVGSFGNDEKYTNAMNKYSIGIEIAAIGSKADMSQYLTSSEYDALDDSLIGFTDEQYKALLALVKDICERNGIPFEREHIIGHDEYNPKKSDPGELFDWGRLF